MNYRNYSWTSAATPFVLTNDQLLTEYEQLAQQHLLQLYDLNRIVQPELPKEDTGEDVTNDLEI